MIEPVMLGIVIGMAPASAVADRAAIDLHEAAGAPMALDDAAAAMSSAEPLHLSFSLQPAETAVKPPFGTGNSWRWQVQLGVGVQVDDSENRFGLVGAGASYFLIDDLSLDVELNGMYIDQVGDNAIAGNVNLLMRWHFYHDRERNWSLYLDGGAGLFQASEDVPSEKGTQFNFTPQLGGGASWQIAENVQMLAGLRWHHISNANLFDVNDGRDSLFAYVGVSFPF